ncbi:hypothetical protein ACTPC6_00630 [Clostridioides difficile]
MFNTGNKITFAHSWERIINIKLKMIKKKMAVSKLQLKPPFFFLKIIYYI